MIRLALADDHPPILEGVRGILGRHPDLEVMASAGSWDDLQDVLSAQQPDLLLLDISMPGPGFVEVMKTLQRRWPDLPVLVLSMHAAEEYAIRCLSLGAAGYVPKGSPAEELVEAVRRVVRRGRYISPEVAELLAASVRSDSPARPAHNDLSDREFQVLRLSAEGSRVKAIAAELGLSPKTVSTYRARIRRKLGLKTFAEVIRYAAERGLFP